MCRLFCIATFSPLMILLTVQRYQRYERVGSLGCPISRKRYIMFTCMAPYPHMYMPTTPSQLLVFTEHIKLKAYTDQVLAEDNRPASTCSIDGDQTLALPSLTDSGDPSSTLGLPSPLRTTVGNACFRRRGNAVVTTVSAATTSGT